jgi:hypothetical protein
MSLNMAFTWGDAGSVVPDDRGAGPGAAQELAFYFSNGKSGFADEIGILRLKSSSAIPR